MASTGAIRAGRAFVEIAGDKSKLMRTLKGAEKDLTSFATSTAKIGGGLLAAGTAILAPLTAAVFEFAAVGDNLDKMAARTGASTEALSELGFAAEQSGASAEVLEKSFTRMQKNLFDAQAGTKKSVDAFKQIGTSYEELKDLSPEEQFLKIGDAIGNIENQAIKAGVANDVFGRSGTRLIPLFDQQREGMEALRQEARDLGISIGPEQAKDAADFTDAYNRMKRSVGAITFAIGGALAPTITDLSKHFVKSVKVVRDWVSENATMIKIAAATGVGLVALGSVIIGVAGVAFTAALGIKLLAAGIGILVGVISFLLSPVGLVIAGLGAIVYFSGLGGKALDWLSERFGELGSFAVETFGLIKKALNANEYKLAADLLWAALKLAWAKGTEGLSVALAEWRSFFVDVWEKAIDNAARFFINAWAKLQEAWTHITQFIGDAWSMAMTGMANAYIELQKFIARQKIVAKLEAQFGEIKEGSNEADLRDKAFAGSDFLFDLEKTKIEADQNKDIFNREVKAKAELDKIKNQQVGANEVIDEQAKIRNDAREQRIKDARQAAKDNITEAQNVFADLTLKVNALPDPDKTGLVKNAKNNANFGDSPTASRAFGKSGTNDLRTQAGLQSLVNLFNQAGENKTLEEIGREQISLLAEMIAAVEDNRIQTLEAG